MDIFNLIFGLNDVPTALYNDDEVILMMGESVETSTRTLQFVFNQIDDGATTSRH